MQETITIVLPESIKPAFENATREEGISADELAAKAIKEYLFHRRFHLLRDRMIPKARAQSIYTDQDVFDQIS